MKKEGEGEIKGLEKGAKKMYHLPLGEESIRGGEKKMKVNVSSSTFSIQQKRAIIKENVDLYHKSTKKQKGVILDELKKLTGYSRKYISYLLNIAKKTIRIKDSEGGSKVILKPSLLTLQLNKRGRKKVYGKELIKPLLIIWKLSDYASSKHLYYFIKENKEWIFNKDELKELKDEEKELIERMSSSTIERLLRDVKKGAKRVFYYKRKKMKKEHIKRRVKIESFYSRKVKDVGYIEIDLVHHGGGSGKGEFFYTLTSVDVMSDWVSLRLLRNKARVWTHRALEDIFLKLPFVPYHIHSDNGSEFINAHIVSFLLESGFEQTRSRSYEKNDNALVEVKNWTMVRGYLGYRRYDTEEEYRIIEKLLSLIEIKHNFFIPTMKRVRIESEEGKGRWSVETPFKRLLSSKRVDDETKKRLIKKKKSINLYELSKEINRLLNELLKVYSRKRAKVKKDDIDFTLLIKNPFSKKEKEVDGRKCL